jgi:hypothetical protein
MMNTGVDVIVLRFLDDTCLKFVNTCVYSPSD